MKEKLCNIKGFEGQYIIYHDANIFSVRKQRMLIPHLNKNTYSKYSYLYITLKDHNSKPLRLALHRVIAHHFIKPILNESSKGIEVNHIDCNKLNNHYTNLELVTHQQNMQHARQNKPNWSEGINRGKRHTNITKLIMSKKKCKKVLLYNDNQSIIYKSIQELCQAQNIYRKKFNRLYSSNRTVNGLNIKML